MTLQMGDYVTVLKDNGSSKDRTRRRLGGPLLRLSPRVSFSDRASAVPQAGRHIHIPRLCCFLFRPAIRASSRRAHLQTMPFPVLLRTASSSWLLHAAALGRPPAALEPGLSATRLRAVPSLERKARRLIAFQLSVLSSRL